MRGGSEARADVDNSGVSSPAVPASLASHSGFDRGNSVLARLPPTTKLRQHGVVMSGARHGWTTHTCVLAFSYCSKAVRLREAPRHRREHVGLDVPTPSAAAGPSGSGSKGGVRAPHAHSTGIHGVPQQMRYFHHNFI